MLCVTAVATAVVLYLYRISMMRRFLRHVMAVLVVALPVLPWSSSSYFTEVSLRTRGHGVSTGIIILRISKAGIYRISLSKIIVARWCLQDSVSSVGRRASEILYTIDRVFLQK